MDSGSSPLARGTVGKNESMAQTIAVHPRWRGEQSRTEQQSIPAYGSSPLARGTVLEALLDVRQPRFIPAGAGNRFRAKIRAHATPVHPRWRGEQRREALAKHRLGGSSPLARGTELVCVATQVDRSVHPRWRGEQFPLLFRLISAGGSSPLARGTVSARSPQGSDQRFIPAGAGNSRTGIPLLEIKPVHPRWRGEQEFFHVQVHACSGSSPLARGTGTP